MKGNLCSSSVVSDARETNTEEERITNQQLLFQPRITILILLQVESSEQETRP